ncbi:MAG TPA: DUF4861 domain-containing protein [Melioribacteraceae bacterium]|nr:DUF4861 domain-containing protein [Melioribacteraceae bacterium]
MSLKKIFPVLLIALSSVVYSQNIKTADITVSNPTEINRVDEMVSIKIPDLIRKFGGFDARSFIILDNGIEIPHQVEGKKETGKISFLVTLKSNEKKTIQIKYGKGVKKSEYKNETYAELAPKKGNIYQDGKFRGTQFEPVKNYKVPSIHKDHDALFKYEGPGWESEIVGYRFYLDWRNATDIFGKKMKKLVLKEVGIHDTVANDDSYHKMQDWGMDIFKVGSTLGIGSIGMWNDGKVNMVSKTDSVIWKLIKNGPLKSEFTTSYYGWLVGSKKYDLNSRISISARSRMTRCDLTIDDAENIVTGLAKYEGTNFIKSDLKGNWQYIALYGKQTLADDDLGIALFYNKKNLSEITEDNISHIIKLVPKSSKVTYYFCAAWVQEPGGIKNEKEFVNYLNNTALMLSNPLTIEF